MTPGDVAFVTEDDMGLGPVCFGYPRGLITPIGFMKPSTKVLVFAIESGGNVIVLSGRSIVRLIGDAQLSFQPT